MIAHELRFVGAAAFTIATALSPGTAWAQAASASPCDLTGYSAQDGLRATASGNGVRIEWTGDAGRQVRLAIDRQSGQPVIRDFAIQRPDGSWAAVLHDAAPTFAVTTGLRRISGQQLVPLKGLNVPLTQAVIDKYRWDPFWDAPLDFSPPGSSGRNPPPEAGIPGTDQPGLPRQASEIERADARFEITGCAARTDGARIVVSLPGVKLGAFTGRLQYTVFRGTGLVRQEIVASTAKPWVAYKFSAGVSGLARTADTQVRWRDTANEWQSYQMGGAINRDAVPLVASHRLVTVESNDAALSLFPEPHRFFWSREVAINMGYNWYRKDSDSSFSVGIRHNDREDESESPANWALYSARPGTEQRMPVYLYPSLGNAEANAASALAFTHGDRYKPLPGYQVMNHHYHMDLGERLLASGSVDAKLPDLVVLKALGVNIVSQIDSVLFRGDVGAEGGDRPGAGAAGRPAATPARRSREPADPLKVTAAAVAGARASSDRDFLVMANQEIFDSPLGGHTDILFSHPVYWDRRKPDQGLEGSDPRYGKVYHIGDAADFMAMVRNENALVSMPHPRTKGSTGFPDAVKDMPFFRDGHYDGVGMRWGMGLDGSERRLCEYRCWPLLDDMSNWMSSQPGPLKHILSISEVRHMKPGDDVYSSQPVTYLKLDKLPTVDDTSSVIRALTAGDSFWTTGEVLATNFSVHYAGAKSIVEADVEWTFPLEFVEIIWGDGKTTKRKIVSTTDLPPHSSQHFKIPVDLRGSLWVRFAAWDNAANGAVLQPVRVTTH